MLRLTAELADHWNGGMPSLDALPGMLAEMDEEFRRAMIDAGLIVEDLGMVGAATGLAAADGGGDRPAGQRWRPVPGGTAAAASLR